MTTNEAEQNISRIAGELHPHCVVCGQDHPWGLHLNFQPQPDGSVTASCECGSLFQGYNDRMHGGVIASILDGAMANCLFANNVVAVTAELNVRYRHPVELNCQTTVKAWIERATTNLYILKAELKQDDKVKAISKGKFFAQA